MAEVSCGVCPTVVGVRKNSAAQTSVQWHGDSAETCQELRQSRAAGLHPALVPACSALRAAIDAAVGRGLVPVDS